MKDFYRLFYKNRQEEISNEPAAMKNRTTYERQMSEMNDNFIS